MCVHTGAPVTGSVSWVVNSERADSNEEVVLPVFKFTTRRRAWMSERSIVSRASYGRTSAGLYLAIRLR